MTKVATQPQTKVIETVKVSKSTKATIEKAIGRQLGSPINNKGEGEEFEVTLTGDIQIREFQQVKGAYLTTKEGYSIKVNASFDPLKHKENAVLTAKCVVLPKNEELGITRDVKYCVFVD